MDEERTESKPSYWAVIPADIRYDDTIPANAKLLYGEISALAGANGFCFCKNEYFMQNYQWTDRTVSRLLSALEDRGYIKIVKRQSSFRKIYAGINPLAGVERSVDTEKTNSDKNVGVACTYMSKDVSTQTKLSGNSDKNVGLHINNNINNIPPIVPQGTCVCVWKSERFEKLWQFYPHDKRGHKQRAAKVWDKLKLDDDSILLMGRALKHDMATEEWRRGIGIPHLSTYLNGKNWLDSLELMAEEIMPMVTDDPEVHHV